MKSKLRAGMVVGKGRFYRRRTSYCFEHGWVDRIVLRRT